jgi:hypothetical protein
MKRILFTAGALMLTFTAGVATGMKSEPFATTINAGLVNALNSVGQNLFGTSAFGARIQPPTPVRPESVQIDIVAIPWEDFGLPPSPIMPKIINLVVGYPPDEVHPCRIGMQITVEADGTMNGIINPDVQVAHLGFMQGVETLGPTDGRAVAIVGTAFCGADNTLPGGDG